jgi:hypothetical protein
LLPLSVPASNFALLSLHRLGLVIFPIYLALATLGRNPRTHTAIIATSTLLLGITIVEWATFNWVA